MGNNSGLKIELYQSKLIGCILGNIGVVPGIQRLQFGVLLKKALNVSQVLFTHIVGRELIIKGSIGDVSQYEFRFSTCGFKLLADQRFAKSDKGFKIYRFQLPTP
jgi:hypothetical protein